MGFAQVLPPTYLRCPICGNPCKPVERIEQSTVPATVPEGIKTEGLYRRRYKWTLVRCAGAKRHEFKQVGGHALYGKDAYP